MNKQEIIWRVGLIIVIVLCFVTAFVFTEFNLTIGIIAIIVFAIATAIIGLPIVDKFKLREQNISKGRMIFLMVFIGALAVFGILRAIWSHDNFSIAMAITYVGLFISFAISYLPLQQSISIHSIDNKKLSLWMVIGVVIGAGTGIATGNFAIGISVGLAVGAIIGAIVTRKSVK